MNKSDILAQILSEYEARLAKLPEEREVALARASPANREFMEQSFDQQQRVIQGTLVELYRVMPAAHRQHETVSEGSLLEVGLELIDGRTQQWWMILSCVYGKLGAVTVGGEQVLIQGGALVSELLLGRKAGDRIQHPPFHGDRRDRITHVTIKEVL
jgi:hypothetical protein